MAKKDHVYMFILDGVEGKEASLAFCEADNYTKEDAREQVRRVLEKEQGFASYSLSYVGIIDYQDMDPETGGKLGYFEKHNPVWLF